MPAKYSENRDFGKPTKEEVNVARKMIKYILQKSRAKSLSTGPAEQFLKCRAGDHLF